MRDSANTPILQSLADVSSMVFAMTPPDAALQSLTDALGVQSVTIGRRTLATRTDEILMQSANATFGSVDWSNTTPDPMRYTATLGETALHRDTVTLQTRLHAVSDGQRTTLETHLPYLRVLWSSRPARFERALAMGRVPAEQSVLHPDNPYRLTPTEFRICNHIAAGQRPAEMAQTLKTSLPTVRTHLRNIYSKTGLDGMLGVLNNLQQNGDDHWIAG